MTETKALESQLREGADIVESVARVVTGIESAVLGPWSVTDLAPGRAGNPTSGAVVRVAGVAHVDQGDLAWSAVLKELQLPDGDGSFDSPQHPAYWRRELELAASGLLSDTQGVRAPDVYRLDEPSTTSAWLWLEDLGEFDREPWTEDDYGRVARALGAFHAVTLGQSGSAIPGWLDRPDSASVFAEVFRVTWDALIAGSDSGRSEYRALLAPELAPVLELAREPGPMLRLASSVPSAVCHNDFNPDNVLLRSTSGGQDDVVAIDWQMAVCAPVSSDLSQLTCYLPETLQGRTREQVESSVVAEYLSALELKGFVLEPESVLAAMVADGAVRQTMFSVWQIFPDLSGSWAAGDENDVRTLVDRYVASILSSAVPDLARRAQACSR